MSSFSLTLQDLEAAITREENVNPAYNNPGAIMSGGSLAQYPTPQAGQNALENLLTGAITGQSQYYQPNESLEQFEETYTGGDINAGSNVASILGIPSTTPINSFGTVAASVQPNAQNPATAPTTLQQIGAAFNDQFGPSIFGATVGPSVSNPTASYSSVTLPGGGKYQIPSVLDVVAVVAGLVLLAGMVFGFRTLTTTVVQGAKKGAELAAA